MSKEILDSNNMETLKPVNETKAELGSAQVDTKKMAEEMLADEEALKIDGEASQLEYQKTLAEAKEMKNPEEELAALEDDFKGRERDYHSITYKGHGTSGTGGIDFNQDNFKKIKDITDKYPGIDKIAELLAIAEKDNTPEKVGGFMGIGATKKEPKLPDNNYVAIKSALILGSFGRFRDPRNRAEEAENAQKEINNQKKVIDFLAENNSELLKTKRYQEIIKNIGEQDREFLEKHRDLLTTSDKLSDQPTSINSAIGAGKAKKQLEDFKKASGIEKKFATAA